MIVVSVMERPARGKRVVIAEDFRRRGRSWDMKIKSVRFLHGHRLGLARVHASVAAAEIEAQEWLRSGEA